MKRLLAISTILICLVVAGCDEDGPQKKIENNDANRSETAPADANEKTNINGTPTGRNEGVDVTIKPQAPIASDCLEAGAKGLKSNEIFEWKVNDITVQKGTSNRYCLENSRRGDVISVSVVSPGSGGTASVEVANSPPRVIDSRIELINDGEESYVKISPEVEDADEDYVAFEFKWLINNVVIEDYTDNRLPAKAYHQGDILQVRIVPDDGYIKGPAYQTRKVSVPSGAPVISSQPPMSFEAMEYAYQVQATDPDNSELTFSLEIAPQGMSIDPASGSLVWPLAGVAPDKYQVRIVVTDPEGNTGKQEFTLNLMERKQPK